MASLLSSVLCKLWAQSPEAADLTADLTHWILDVPMSGHRLPGRLPSLLLSINLAQTLVICPSAKGVALESISRVGGAEDEHGAVGHHGFAGLTLLLLLLLLLYLLFLFFDICLLQGTGFSISLVANCKRNTWKFSETWHSALQLQLGTAQLGKGCQDAPSQAPCKHWGHFLS